jgi:hypothetical protein
MDHATFQVSWLVGKNKNWWASRSRWIAQSKNMRREKATTKGSVGVCRAAAMRSLSGAEVTKLGLRREK